MNRNILIHSGELASRILLAAIFLAAGLGKLAQYAGTQAYMASAGVAGAFLPLVIALEIAGGIALIAGWQVRVSAGILAGFTLLAAILFHANFADPMQQILFMKNMAICGGLLSLMVHGPGHWSVQQMLRPRRLEP